MHKLKLIARFYRGLFLANSLITLSCLYLLQLYGPHAAEILGILFWYKVISIIVVFYVSIYYKKNELYYYQNLGIRQLQLIIITSIFDFMLWLAAVILQMEQYSKK